MIVFSGLGRFERSLLRILVDLLEAITTMVSSIDLCVCGARFEVRSRLFKWKLIIFCVGGLVNFCVVSLLCWG